MTNLLKVEGYNPGALFDRVIEIAQLRSDSALARALGTGAPSICKIRGKHSQMTADLLIRMYDLTGRSIDELRRIAGIPKTPLSNMVKPVKVEPNDIVEVLPADAAPAPDTVEVQNV